MRNGCGKKSPARPSPVPFVQPSFLTSDYSLVTTHFLPRRGRRRHGRFAPPAPFGKALHFDIENGYEVNRDQRGGNHSAEYDGAQRLLTGGAGAGRGKQRR